MYDIYQKTLASEVIFKGIGLHSGKPSTIKLIPSQENSGIVFKRVDLGQNNLINANYTNVTSTKLCTTLENSFGTKVSTVEHLLAAVYIYGIDNLIVEIDNEEVPIMDGSAKIFLENLSKVDLINQSEKRKYLKVIDKVELVDGERKISIEPSHESFEIDFQLNYKNKVIGKQRNKFNFLKDNIKDISDSRTFCLYNDIKKIKNLGLAKGGSLDNAIVVDNNKVLNEDGLRNKKEFVNHKILDLIGDFLLSGHRLIGKIKCYQGGHELSNMFLKKLFQNKLSTNLVELQTIDISNNHNSLQIGKIAVNA